MLHQNFLDLEALQELTAQPEGPLPVEPLMNIILLPRILSSITLGSHLEHLDARCCAML